MKDEEHQEQLDEEIMSDDTEYTVEWTIDLDAPNPISAALQAQEIQRDEHGTATIYVVTGPDGTYRVDLGKPGEETTVVELNEDVFDASSIEADPMNAQRKGL